MAIRNKASAHWGGGLKGGAGTFSTASGVMSGVRYDFRKRFEGEAGTNPEELLGAAHAACMAMQTAAMLERAGITPEAVDVGATVTLDFVDGAPTVTGVHLDIAIRAPGAAEADLLRIAGEAKAACLVTRLFNAPVTYTATVA
jgi:osmotically inducible protein OsmC